MCSKGLKDDWSSQVKLGICLVESVKVLPITTQHHILTHKRYIAVENIVRRGEIACNKQFLLFSQRFPLYMAPRLGGSVVSVLDSWLGGCEFDPRLKRLFFPANFRLSPLQKHVRKVVGGFGKKSCVSTGVRKPGNTYSSPTVMIWP